MSERALITGEINLAKRVFKDSLDYTKVKIHNKKYKPFVEMLGVGFNVKVVRYPATEAMGYAELEAVARAELPTEGPFVI